MTSSLKLKIVTPVERRGRARREAVDHRTVVVKAGTRILARVTDLSVEGACLRCPARLTVHDAVRVVLPEVGSLPATVCWSLNGAFGCCFETSLAQDQFHRVLAAMDLPPAATH